MVKLENTNLLLTKGDSCLLRLELIDENNEAVDMAGATATLTVKEYLNDASIKEKISLQMFEHPDSDPAGGIIFFKFLPINTQNLQIKKYYWDIQVNRDADIYTILRGDIYIEAEIKLNA
jgi:hypothetical protein